MSNEAIDVNDEEQLVDLLGRTMAEIEAGEEVERQARASLPALDPAQAPLSELYRRLDDTLERADFARTLAERLQDGRDGEVVEFFRTCEERCLNILSHLGGDDAPWLASTETWLAFARMTIPRGQLYHCSREIPRRSPELAAELRALADAWLARARTEGKPGHQGVGLVLARILPLLWYPEMSREDCLAHIEWALALRAEVGSDYNTGWYPFIAGLSEAADLIALAERGGRLCKDVLEVYRKRIEDIPAPHGWAPWHAFFALHPEVYDDNAFRDPGLIELRWSGASAKRRQQLADALFSCLSYHDRAEREYTFAVFDRLVREDAEPFVAQLREWGRYDISFNLAWKVCTEPYPELLPLMLPAIASRCENDCEASRYRRIVRHLVASRPDDLVQVPTKDLVHLLPTLDAASLSVALPVLTRVVAGSSSKALRDALSGIAARFAPADLVAAGWLRKPPKNLLLACRDVLLAHSDPSAAPLLAELLAGGKLDAASASMVEERLQQLGQGVAGPTEDAAGEAVPAADPAAALATVEAQAATVKRIAASVKHYDSPELLALCAPLSEHAARVLLHLTATAEDSLSPLVAKLLTPIAADNRARLALALAEVWIASNGDPKLRWALKLLPGNADDRVVDQLVAAINVWNKPRLQRAAAATEQLGEVDTLYALLRVQEIAESRKLKDMVVSSARQALRAAAQRRQMSVAELFDELTPDFGLGEGLTLVVGPNAYRVELQGDLSLRVVNDKGKAAKSIPAVKDAALKPEWEAASAKLKGLASNLKTVVKQQAPRMYGALVTGKRWPLARWQRLFVQHPLLRIVGRSLIWRAEDAPDLARSSFRLAEDFSLVDVEDEAVVLPESCSVSLWHPATALAGELEAWQAYFADYEMEPMVDQLGACAELPPAELFKDEQLLAPPGLVVAQEQLAGLAKKWGYRPGPVGDGPSINEHTWRLPALELSIELHHGYFPPWMDIGSPVEIECFMVRDLSQGWAWIKPADLPKPLQATLMGQIRALQAKASEAQTK